LDPGSIHINTLFINPGTKLYDQQEEYNIETNNDNKWLFSVPTLVSSNTFSKNDIKLAKIYIDKLSKKYPNTHIILR
jgi:hypothetical protein